MGKNKKKHNAVAEATETAVVTDEPTATEPTEATEVAAETTPEVQATEVAEPTATEPTEATEVAAETAAKPSDDEVIADSVVDAINELLEVGNDLKAEENKRIFSLAWHKCFDIQTPFEPWWKYIKAQF
ncbi:MAG: hypothetical protein K5685_09705 [Bacteroidales bacterium]|nr:hypothetical protein [Bacteroidales bacterium]